MINKRRHVYSEIKSTRIEWINFNISKRVSKNIVSLCLKKMNRHQ